MPTVFVSRDADRSHIRDVWHPEYQILIRWIVHVLRSMSQHEQNLAVKQIGGLRTRESQPSPTEVAMAAAEQGKLGKLWSQVVPPSEFAPTLIDGDSPCA